MRKLLISAAAILAAFPALAADSGKPPTIEDLAARVSKLEADVAALKNTKPVADATSAPASAPGTTAAVPASNSTASKPGAEYVPGGLVFVRKFPTIDQGEKITAIPGADLGGFKTGNFTWDEANLGATAPSLQTLGGKRAYDVETFLKVNPDQAGNWNVAVTIDQDSTGIGTVGCFVSIKANDQLVTYDAQQVGTNSWRVAGALDAGAPGLYKVQFLTGCAVPYDSSFTKLRKLRFTVTVKPPGALDYQEAKGELIVKKA